MRKLFVIAAFLGLIIGLFGMYYFGYAHGALGVTGKAGVSIDQTKSIPAKEISKIALESNLSSVHFYPSKSNQLTVHLKGTAADKNIVFSVNKSGDTANIEVGIKQKHFSLSFSNFMMDHLQTYVEVPNKIYREIRGHSQAGSIHIEQLAANHFDLDSSAGSITAEDLKGDVTAHSSAGSLNLTNTVGRLNLTDSAGSIEIHLKDITHDITAHSSAGSVRLFTDNQPKALQLNLHTSAGSANVNLPNVSYSTKDHNRVVGSIGTGGPMLQLESSAGSVSINQ